MMQGICGNRVKYIKASLTIEAALVLPVFLFGMITLISVFSVLRFNLAMESAITMTAMDIAKKAAVEWDISDDEIAESLKRILGDNCSSRAPVEGGIDSIDYSGSELNNREIVKIKVSYKANPPYNPWNLFMPDFNESITVHTWIGYETGLDGYINENLEEYVYVTEYGTVYHRDRNCSHITLNIREVQYRNIATLRNSGGHRYYQCEQCRPDSSSRHIYITEDGDRFHGSLSCSGLKRTIYVKKLSEIGNLRACSKCGRGGYSWNY